MDKNIEIKDIGDRHAKLLIEGVPPYFVNALRRVLLAEVPKLAIDRVTFYDNTSALFDEIVSHRLGLLPIPTDPSTLNLKGQMDDEGNPVYVVRYTLTKEGPGVAYSGDLEPEDPSFALADPKIPIVELLEGQRLILEAEAVLGDGTQHAKWQACHAVGYKYYPTVTIDQKKIKPGQAELAVARTPQGILSVKAGKLVVLDEENVNRANEAEKICGDGFRLEHDDRRFLFRFETDGSLKAEDAFLKGLELLKERVRAFGDAVDGLK